MSDSTSDFPTTIGADAVFKGQLECSKGMRLLGKFDGEITGDGEVLVAEGAKLSGDVKASSIRIDGEVKGNLAIDAKVQLTGSARLEGDVQAARLEVAEGAVLIGKCTVGVNGKGRSAAQARTASAPVSAVTPGKSKAGAAQPVGRG